MSQPDLLTQLRESRPLAPDEVREHVRRIAAQSAEPRRRRFALTWRRGFVLAVPVAAVAAGAVVLSRGGGPPSRSHQVVLGLQPPASLRKAPPELAAGANGSTGANGTNSTSGAVFSASGAVGATGAVGAPVAPGALTSLGSQADQAAFPATSQNRVQRVTGSLQLRLKNAGAVSAGAKQATHIARALGGYASQLDVNAQGKDGYANLTLRIPKQNLQQAVSRLSNLGTVVGENVSIKDLTAKVDATTRKLARLKARLAAWQEQPQTDETQQHIAALTDQIGKLRRGRSNTVRTASYATLGVQLSTRQAVVPRPAHHGKSHFHNLGVAFRWAGIGAVYALALGAPVALLAALVWLAARTVRRRREEALLSRT